MNAYLNNQNYKVITQSTSTVILKNEKIIKHQLKQLQKMSLRQGVKQLHFCQRQDIVVLLTSDSILIADPIFGQVTRVLKSLAYPRYICLAKSGKFLVVYYSNNTVSIMDLQGKQLSNVLGVPLSSTIFLISQNSQYLLYGNNQTICLWNIKNSQIQVLTKQWKNINCYAISASGNKFALGTYGGSIYVLTIIGQQKVSQFQIKRHKSCVMCVIFHKNSIVSVAYDKSYIQTLIETNQKGEKILTYTQHLLNQVPRCLISCGDRVFLSYMNGFYWFVDGKMIGFNEGTWNVFENKQKEIIFVKSDKAQIQWWKFQKTVLNR